jgi:hypothetical protein
MGSVKLSGYLSGVLLLLAAIPYFRDIFRGAAKPQRTSWFIWVLLGVIAFFSQYAKGASYSLILTGIQVLTDLSIFLLAIKYGAGGFERKDKIAIAGVALSLLLWYLTNEPAVALFMVIFIDLIGAVLTIMKSYEHPATETSAIWILTGLSGIFALISVGQLNWVLLAFPLYIVVINFAIALAITLGRRNKKKI